MKKSIIIALAIVIVLGAYMIVPGLMKCPTMMVNSFTVSEDGSSIELNVSSYSSMGYIRAVTVHQQQGGRLYLDCYAAFGGPNGQIGAKTTYTLPLAEDTEIIAVYRNENSYQEVLKKDENNNWQYS